MGLERRDAVTAPWASRVFAWAAFVVAGLVSSYLAIGTTYAGDASGTDSRGGRWSSSLPGNTLAEVNGSWVYALLLVPVVITAMPLVLPASVRRPAAFVSATLLFLLAVVSLPSIGGGYLPAAGLLLITGLLTEPARPIS